MNDSFFLLDYLRTTAERPCHCDLVPNVLLTERGERSKERESILMSVIHRKGRERITSAWLVDTSRIAGKDRDGVH